MSVVELQYWDPPKFSTAEGKWRNYGLSNIGHDHDSIIVGQKFRILVDGSVIYPPEEVGNQDD